MEKENLIKEKLINRAKKVIDIETNSLKELKNLIDESFYKACKIILNCKGRLIITGIGKSGIIGQKIASSLTSTGIPSYFLHAAEGFHGDLGIIHKQDVLLCISYSGETDEIIELVSNIKRIKIPIISITSRKDSTLAKNSDVVLSIGDIKEADPYNLVPTTSTTLTLVLGDALTIALMEYRNFTPKDFAIFHPKGMLGKKLTLQVSYFLKGKETNPLIKEDATFSDALEIITKYKLGGTSVINQKEELIGIITDGDIRRIIEKFAKKGEKLIDVLNKPVKLLMTSNPTYVTEDTLAYEALKIMENHKPRPIFILPVVNNKKKPIGMIHLHSLVQAGFKSSLI